MIGPVDCQTIYIRLLRAFRVQPGETLIMAAARVWGDRSEADPVRRAAKFVLRGAGDIDQWTSLERAAKELGG